MLYARILSYVMETPWAIRPEKLMEILAFLRVRATGGQVEDEQIRAIIGARPQSTPVRAAGSIGILPVMGTLHHRADLLRDSSGGTSVDRLSAQLKDLVANPTVTAIVLDVNSAGGAVEGIAELAAEVFAARTRKPVTAIANAMMASAAYWLSSAASEVVLTPSGQVGSVGVFGAHQDLSKAMDREGIATTLVSAGKYKTELSPFAPLSDTARAYLQSRVDDYYRMFVRDVARGRGVSQASVRATYGEGRLVGAEQALRAGMIDRVETMDALLARLARRGVQAPPAAAAAGLGTVAAQSLAAPDADLDRRRRRLRLLAETAGARQLPPARELTDLERRRQRLAAAR